MPRNYVGEETVIVQAFKKYFFVKFYVSIIINDDQQDAAILDLFIFSLLYMFRAIPSPIMDEMKRLIHDTSQ
jgi:hypothetical protein